MDWLVLSTDPHSLANMIFRRREPTDNDESKLRPTDQNPSGLGVQTRSESFRQVSTNIPP